MLGEIKTKEDLGEWEVKVGWRNPTKLKNVSRSMAYSYGEQSAILHGIDKRLIVVREIGRK